MASVDDNGLLFEVCCLKSVVRLRVGEWCLDGTCDVSLELARVGYPSFSIFLSTFSMEEIF